MSYIAPALSMAFAMFWEILWALILGFGLSAVAQGGRFQKADDASSA